MSESREMDRAADRFAAAVEEFARQVERLRPHGPLTEEEADRFGNEAVHETRDLLFGGASGFDGHRGPLTDDEVEEWVRRREERREREGYEPV